jgi:hypothetical protein
MEGVTTMNLNDSADAMTPLFSQPAPPKLPEKNVGTLQMDSTPIADIMGSEVDYQMAPPVHQQVYAPQAVAAAPPPKKSTLTNEQMEALLAGVVALVAFSGPVQEKLAGFLPQMLTAAGDRSNTGLVVTALVAAIIFYFARRFLIKA